MVAVAGLLLVNYNGQGHSVGDFQSDNWVSRWACLENNFIYVFVFQSDVAAEDIILCDDTFADIECGHGEFHIQNKHRAERRVSFRALPDYQAEVAWQEAFAECAESPEGQTDARTDEDQKYEDLFVKPTPAPPIDLEQLTQDAVALSSHWVESISVSQSVILDAHRFMNAVLPTRVLDEDVGGCFACQAEFGWFRGRYHCRCKLCIYCWRKLSISIRFVHCARLCHAWCL